MGCVGATPSCTSVIYVSTVVGSSSMHISCTMGSNTYCTIHQNSKRYWEVRDKSTGERTKGPYLQIDKIEAWASDEGALLSRASGLEGSNRNLAARIESLEGLNERKKITCNPLARACARGR